MAIRNEKSLSEYRVEAEQLLEEHALEAAIAIGQHMLRHHPKYVGAYRVLAKATLEQGETGYAADLFRRVLSANPEDLEARLGLGIIYTEEQALEEALWQWERAFELAPGNSDIRAQLRQVRERVEGVEFPRIELTRGALGRLYARGGLFQQAADEFQSVLVKDPQQIDIQVALAETLWRDGKLAEAEAVCEGILETLPNCLKANLILGHIWLRTGREEESQKPFEIAQALDPENQVASELLGEESPLTREPVLVPLLDELPLEAPQPADLIAVGEERLPEEWELEEMAAQEEAIEAELPDWLTELRAAAAGEEEEEETVEGEGLPEWLTALEPEDQKVAAEAAPAEAPSFEPSPEPEPETEDLELPDWLTALSEEGPEEPVTAGEVDDRDAPDWLRQLRTETDRDLTAIGEPELTLTPSPEDIDRFILSDVPEWLQDIRQESDQPIEAISDEEVLLTAAEPAEEVSDQLGGAPAGPEAAESPVEAVEPEDEAADWLTTLWEEEPAETEIAAPAVELEAAETDLWREIMREEGLDEMIRAVPAEVEDLPEEVEPAGEIPDWLTGLREEEPAETEIAPPPIEPEAAETDLWREIMREEGLDEMIRAVPAEVEDLPEEVEPAEDIPDWLAGLREEKPAEPEVAATPAEAEAVEVPTKAVEPEEPAVEIPDWLATVREEEPAEAESAAPPVEPEAAETDLWREIMRKEGLEEMLEAAEAEALPQEAEPAEEVPDWLAALQAEEPAAPEVAETEIPEAPAEAVEPGEPAAEIPDWLAALQAGEPAAPETAEAEIPEVLAEAVEPAEPAAEIPDWLAALQAEEPATPETAEAEIPEVPAEAIEPEEQVPDWLAVFQAEEPAEPEIEEAPVELEAMDTDLWREIMRKEGLEEMLEVAEAEARPEEAEPAEEAPDWLAALQAEEPAEPEVAQVIEPTEAAEEVPDWLAALQAEEAQAPVEPKVAVTAEEEPVAEVATPEILAEAEAVALEAIADQAEEMPAEPEEGAEEIAVETAVEEKAEVEMPAAEIAEEAVPPEETEEVIEKEDRVSFIISSYLSRLDAEPGNHEVRLALARAYRDEKRVDDAWQQFEKLVRSGYQTEELAADLEGLSSAHPNDARWHQLLGDAYLRLNRLNEALDAYRAAQKALSSR